MRICMTRTAVRLLFLSSPMMASFSDLLGFPPFVHHTKMTFWPPSSSGSLQWSSAYLMQYDVIDIVCTSAQAQQQFCPPLGDKPAIMRGQSTHQYP